ncbi:hypothetical protein ABZX62_20155 [Streptomyces flavidovirens]|uniref:hypothetical protein n=1 Tax=Streptomyces flavidovirens TaxID=67298 RepID=UPI0033ABC383
MSARKRAAAIALCVVVAGAGVTVVAAQSSGGGTSTPASDDSGSDFADTADEAGQECTDSWNESNENKASVASIATAAQQSENATAYVNVGFSEVFPDRCMITVANPSTLYAQQYLQDSGNGWSMVPAWTGSVSQIDSSNLPWNGRMAKDGTIIIL